MNGVKPVVQKAGNFYFCVRSHKHQRQRQNRKALGVNVESEKIVKPVSDYERGEKENPHNDSEAVPRAFEKGVNHDYKPDAVKAVLKGGRKGKERRKGGAPVFFLPNPVKRQKTEQKGEANVEVEIFV